MVELETATCKDDIRDSGIPVAWRLRAQALIQEAQNPALAHTCACGHSKYLETQLKQIDAGILKLREFT